MVKKDNRYEKIRKWILWGVPVQILAGIFLHNAFLLLGRNALAAIFAPVNESVFEHLKLVFWPVVIWWILGYIIYSKKENIDPNKYLAGCAAAVAVGVLIVIFGHYGFIGIFGTYSVLFHIILFILALLIGAFAAFCTYKYSQIGTLGVFLSFVILVLFLTSFILFTFAPPHLPFFLDSTTGMYGIGIYK